MAFIKINRQNFFHNLNQIALKTGSVKKIAIVLKDNAYGHGLELMAALASEYGIEHAVVRKRDEAKKIEAFFKTVLVLGDTIVQDEKITYAVNTLEDIPRAQKASKIELKVDTGMHRNGIAMDELDTALKMIVKHELELVGVMTHFRSADVLSSELFWQHKNFKKVKERVLDEGFTTVRFHSSNSAALLRTKDFSEDLVRVGIAAYGYHELDDIFDEVALKPVLSLYAKKISERRLKSGERVGYGGDYVASKAMVVSTYDLGYGDGWHRSVNSEPFVIAHNIPIMGRVSMDFITLPSNENEVCIMNNAKDTAKKLHTISYEVLTALHANIERSVV